MPVKLNHASYAIMLTAAGGVAAGLTFGAGSIHAGTVVAQSKKQVPHVVRKTGSLALDRASWLQFIRAVTPSSATGKVVYETWASDQDIYVANPCAPGGGTSGCNTPTWPSPTATSTDKAFQQSALGRSHLGLVGSGQRTPVQVIGPAQGCGTPPGLTGAAANSGFPASGCVGEEVRRDRASFNYIVSNNLWSTKGLVAFYATQRTVAFPNGVLQVKADWIPVATLATWLNKPASFVTGSFYTSSATLNGQRVLYAMTSMHLSLKAPGYPDWIWANFENAYTPGRCDQTGCSDAFGAVTPTVAPNAQPWQQYGSCPHTSTVNVLFRTAKVAPVFGNYCLTGTQTSFGTAANPTLLGSSIIEPLNAHVPLSISSCISCHAGASFNAQGTPGPVGAPTGPHSYPAGYRGYDFLWGVLFAQ